MAAERRYPESAFYPDGTFSQSFTIVTGTAAAGSGGSIYCYVEDKDQTRRLRAKARLDRIKIKKSEACAAIASFLQAVGRMRARSLIDGGRVTYDVVESPMKAVSGVEVKPRPVRKKVKPIELE